MAVHSVKYSLNRYFPDLNIPRLALDNNAAEKDVRQILHAITAYADIQRQSGQPEEHLIDMAISRLNVAKVAADMGTTEEAVRRIVRGICVQLQLDRPRNALNSTHGISASTINNDTRNTNPNNGFSNPQSQVQRNPTRFDTLISQVRHAFAHQTHALILPPPPRLHPQLLWPEPVPEHVQLVRNAFLLVISNARCNAYGGIGLHARDVQTLLNGMNLLVQRTEQHWASLSKTAKANELRKKERKEEKARKMDKAGKVSTEDSGFTKASQVKNGNSVVPQSLVPPQLGRSSGGSRLATTEGQAILEAPDISPVRPPHLQIGIDGVARPILHGLTVSGSNTAAATNPTTARHVLPGPRKHNSVQVLALRALAPSTSNITPATNNAELPAQAHGPTDKPDKTAGKHVLLRTPGNSPVKKRAKAMPKPGVKKATKNVSFSGGLNDGDKENGGEAVCAVGGLVGGEY
ncbi:uncharacterized protein EI97DRAFT_460334 [Westerdykella ornata]|uniref:Uncharacterized protein n=1 Tax=Westerdykella ornata TaxID=318751 RepID=A0A6A6JD61_WESOR|nr:uncharacterized protein EI97DRAFT_460334 [Westerdykella ornata]KAF2274207.1 hypothetical protein EI97DRAFT_460334 [Westerdykella ornata]